MNNPYLTSLLERLEKVNQETEAAFGQLDRAQLNWKPGPLQWSVGQCLDHLIKTNEQYFEVFRDIAKSRKRKTFWESLPVLPGLFGKMLVRSNSPETRRKFRTVPVFEPSQSDLPESIVADLRAHNREMAAHFKRLDLVDHQRTIITSPASRFVTYSLEDACNLIVNHEERHLLQARRVIESEGFPGR